MADERVLGEIKIDISGAQSSIKILQKQLNELDAQFIKTEKDAPNFKKATEGAKTFSEGITGSIKSMIGLGSAMAIGEKAVELVIKGFEKLVDVIKESVKIAMDEELANEKMFAVLGKNNTEYEKMLKFKKENMKTTLYSREEINASVNMGLEMGRTADQIADVIKASEGLAMATGKDLNTTMLMLASTLEGQIGRLGRFAGGVKALTLEQLKNGDAIDIILKKYGDYATYGIESTEGKINQLEKSWSFFTISLGDKFLPVLGRIVEAGKEVVDLFTEWLEIPMSEKIQNESDNINVLADTILSLTEGTAGRVDLLKELITLYPDYFGNLNAETTTNDELRKVLSEVNYQYERKIELMVLQEEKDKLEAEGAELRKKQRTTEKEITKEYGILMKNELDRKLKEKEINKETYDQGIKQIRLDQENLSLDEKIKAMKEALSKIPMASSFGTVENYISTLKELGIQIEETNAQVSSLNKEMGNKQDKYALILKAKQDKWNSKEIADTKTQKEAKLKEFDDYIKALTVKQEEANRYISTATSPFGEVNDPKAAELYKAEIKKTEIEKDNYINRSIKKTKQQKEVELSVEKNYLANLKNLKIKAIEENNKDEINLLAKAIKEQEDWIANMEKELTRSPSKPKAPKKDPILDQNRRINEEKLLATKLFWENTIKIVEDSNKKLNDISEIELAKNITIKEEEYKNGLITYKELEDAYKVYEKTREFEINASYENVKRQRGIALEEELNDIKVGREQELEDLKIIQKKENLSNEEYKRLQVEINQRWDNKETEYRNAYNQAVIIDEGKNTRELLKIRQDYFKDLDNLTKDDLRTAQHLYKEDQKMAKESSIQKIEQIKIQAKYEYEAAKARINARKMEELASAKTPEEISAVNDKFTISLDNLEKGYESFGENINSISDGIVKKQEDWSNSFSDNLGSQFSKVRDDFTLLINDILKHGDDTKKILQDISKVALDTAQVISDQVFSNLASQIKNETESALKEIDRLYTQESIQLDQLLKDKAISQEQYDKQMYKLNAEKIKKEKEAKEDAWKKQRDADVLQAIINGILSVTAALTVAPPAGYIMAAINAATALVNVGLIESQPMPTFKKGGRVKEYATGGVITGPSHDLGGVPLIAEGGEQIFSREKTKQFSPWFNAIQNSPDGSTPPMVAQVDNEAITRAVVAAIIQIPVVVSEYDMTRTQKKVSTIEYAATW